MKRGRSVGAFLRSPQYLAAVASLLAVWGLLTGRFLAVVGAACAFYLAWHAKRFAGEEVRPSSETTVSLGLKRIRVSWLLLISIGIGALIGANQVYARFLSLGWPRASAGSAALLISGGVGIVIWIIARKIMARRQ